MEGQEVKEKKEKREEKEMKEKALWSGEIGQSIGGKII